MQHLAKNRMSAYAQSRHVAYLCEVMQGCVMTPDSDMKCECTVRACVADKCRAVFGSRQVQGLHAYVAGLLEGVVLLLADLLH